MDLLNPHNNPTRLLFKDEENEVLEESSHNCKSELWFFHFCLAVGEKETETRDP